MLIYNCLRKAERILKDMTIEQLKDFIKKEVEGLNGLIKTQQERMKDEPNRKTNNYKFLKQNTSELLSALEVYNDILRRIDE